MRRRDSREPTPGCYGERLSGPVEAVEVDEDDVVTSCGLVAELTIEAGASEQQQAQPVDVRATVVEQSPDDSTMFHLD